MRKIPKGVALVALSATFATVLGLEIGIPLGIANNQTTYNYFNGLAKTTNYLVGNNITLKLNNVINPQGYTYQWYIKTADAKEFTKLADTPSGEYTINSAPSKYSNAQVACVLINNDNQQVTGKYHSYALTQLVLSEAFEVSQCAINVAPSTNNSYYYDQTHSALALQTNSSVTLTTNATVNSAYSSYLKYQWYENEQPISGATQNTYTISSKTELNTNTYSVKAYLLAGDSQSASVSSQNVKVQTVNSINLTADPISISVPEWTANDKIPAGNNVTLTANFKLNNQNLEENGSNYTVKYSWYHKNVLIPNANAKTYTIQNASANDYGNYYCEASIIFNDSGATITKQSNETLVNITEPDKIMVANGFKDVTILNGDTVSQKVEATLENKNGEDQTLAYQWYAKSPTGKYEEIKLTTDTLALNTQQACKANGYTFVCKVYSPTTAAQIQPIYTDPFTVNVLNPKFTTSVTTDPASNLLYGGKVKLTANVSTVDQETTDPSFETTYGYQWFEQVNGKWQKVATNGTNQSLEIPNLSPNCSDSYKCFVYPNKAYAPNDTAWESLGAYTEVTHLTPTAFDVVANATVASVPEKGAVALTTSDQELTNNLGNNFDLNLKVNLNNYSSQLPQGYSYTYDWQRSASKDTANNETWSSISQSQENCSNLASNQAGVWYYRCLVSIVYNPTSSQPTQENQPKLKTADAESNSPATPIVVQTISSNPVEINTYPQAVVTNNNTNPVIPHNATITLAPEIALKTSLDSNTLVDPKDLNTDLGLCNPTYKWTYNSKQLESSNISTEYPFIQGDCDGATLTINSAICNMQSKQDNTCAGTYSLTVTINGQDYKIDHDYTVTEGEQTFNVTNATAKAKAGENTIQFSAQVSPLKSTLSRSKREAPTEENNQDSQPQPQPATYTYNWYAVYTESNVFKTTKTVKLNTQPLSSANWTYNSASPVLSSWENLSFYCEAINTQTQEIEWNTTKATFNLEKPTMKTCTVSGNTSVDPNTPITLTASANPSFFVDNLTTTYNWYYFKSTAPAASTNAAQADDNSNSDSSSSGTWEPITDIENVVKITQPTSTQNNNGTLELLNPTYAYNGLKIKCIANYGNYVTDVNSSESTLSINKITLPETTETTITDFANQMETDYLTPEKVDSFCDEIGLTKGSTEMNITGEVKSKLLNMIGITDPKQQTDMFAKRGITLTQKLTLPETEVSKSTKDGPAQPQPAVDPNQQDAKVTVEVNFTLNPGYTWDLASNVLPANAKVTDQTLTVYIPTTLKHSFYVKKMKSGTYDIQLGKNSKNFTINVIASKPVSNFSFYVVIPGYEGKPIPFNDKYDQIRPYDDLFIKYFGPNCKPSVKNNTPQGDGLYKTASITFNNVKLWTKLSGIKIYAAASLASSDSYFEQVYTAYPFTLTFSMSGRSNVNHSNPISIDKKED